MPWALPFPLRGIAESTLVMSAHINWLRMVSAGNRQVSMLGEGLLVAAGRIAMQKERPAEAGLSCCVVLPPVG
jgi:hypothetical protein